MEHVEPKIKFKSLGKTDYDSCMKKYILETAEIHWFDQDGQLQTEPVVDTDIPKKYERCIQVLNDAESFCMLVASENKRFQQIRKFKIRKCKKEDQWISINKLIQNYMSAFYKLNANTKLLTGVNRSFDELFQQHSSFWRVYRIRNLIEHHYLTVDKVGRDGNSVLVNTEKMLRKQKEVKPKKQDDKCFENYLKAEMKNGVWDEQHIYWYNLTEEIEAAHFQLSSFMEKEFKVHIEQRLLPVLKEVLSVIPVECYKYSEPSIYFYYRNSDECSVIEPLDDVRTFLKDLKEFNVDKKLFINPIIEYLDQLGFPKSRIKRVMESASEIVVNSENLC